MWSRHRIARFPIVIFYKKKKNPVVPNLEIVSYLVVPLIKTNKKSTTSHATLW